MSTIAPAAPAGAAKLRAEIRQRALKALRAENGTTLYGLQEMTGVDAYWQGPEAPGAMEPDWLGKEWLEQLEAAVQAAAREAIVASVIPAMAEVMADMLPSAPHDLIEYRASKQLRADLATLEGKS